MKKIIWIVIILLVIFGIYKFTKQSPVEEAAPIVVTLNMQENSGEKGEAKLMEVDGQVKVAIALTGAPADLPQPSHLHKGSCANLGEPIFTLSPVLDGASETTLLITKEALVDNLPLALNVHKSTTNLNNYVACGDLIIK